MLDYNPLDNLPTSAELPDSDDTPVDNELQNIIPNLLKAVLALIWATRNDWFMGVDMGIYDRTGQIRRTPIVPDAFLSLGVERLKGQLGRLSYVLAEENNIVPILVLEFVSQTYGEEYGQKMTDYARMGVLYYVIYNPDHWRRDRHEPLEVYQLIEGEYVRQPGEPVWMPEIGLGIGREVGICEQWQRDWLYWYDEQGNRYPVPEEVISRLQQRLEMAQSQLEQEQQRIAEMESLLTKYRKRFGELPENCF
ncbi:Uma2 family endonuclease [Funiculus sociatus]|nr:Uma2 family endonuclease [Trichocoleus sp. FACHB-69]